MYITIGIVIFSVVLLGGLVAALIVSYGLGKGRDWVVAMVVSLFATTIGLYGIIVNVIAFYANPDVPVEVEMEVAATYTSVDGRQMVVLQWQRGKKMDNEATFGQARFKTTNPLDVGARIVRLDNGSTIVLPDRDPP